MASNFNNENDPWEYSLDINDSDLHLTLVLRSSSSARVEPSPYTPNPVTIIPGPAGIVQLSSSTCVEPSSSTSNPKVLLRMVGEDDDYYSGEWYKAPLISAGNLNVTMKDLSETIPGTVHHKVIGEGGYAKEYFVEWSEYTMWQPIEAQVMRYGNPPYTIL
ncbi:hypothetical protein Tco_0464971 [Tanacetum coccineum]